MPTGADLGPDLTPSVCHVCGRPAETSYWIDDRRWKVHTQCRDWTRVEFIFAHQLRTLRRRRDDPGVAELVQWLESARRQWPVDALLVVNEGQQRLRALGM